MIAWSSFSRDGGGGAVAELQIVSLVEYLNRTRTPSTSSPAKVSSYVPFDKR